MWIDENTHLPLLEAAWSLSAREFITGSDGEKCAANGKQTATHSMAATFLANIMYLRKG
jgi:hypothetical protein